MVGNIKERRRVRELSRYYCAAAPILRHKAPKHSHPNIHSIQSDLKSVSPCLSSDSRLTALAQLAALRLKCQRSFISIIDDHTQYVIAEATQSISMYNKDEHEPGDELLVGVQAVPLAYGVCPVTLAAFTGESRVSLMGPNNSAEKTHIVIEDLLAEDKVRHLPALQRLPPVLRHYVEVPLLSESGYLIGSICVVDPKPRRAGPRDVCSLQEIAGLVVEHLEDMRMREDHRRVERLSEGLAHFVQGKDSISDWTKATKGQVDIPQPVPEPTHLSSALLLGQKSHTEREPAFTTTPNGDATASITDQESSATFASSVDLSLTGQTSILPTTAGISQNTADGLPSDMADFEPQTAAESLPANPSIDEARPTVPIPRRVRHAFSRASNLIRECMDLDATCFLEVPQNERYKHPTQSKSSTRIQEERGSSSSSLSEAEKHAHPNGSAAVPCVRLGFSTRTKSSLAGSTAAASHFTISARLLSRLTAAYPEGHIFHFDALGSISSDEDNFLSEPAIERRFRRQKGLSASLFETLPTIRSLIFLPLYDNDKQQVYAGFLGWTIDPARALQDKELVYISGFANSIMCEVMRLNTVSTDKAKSDFISSISHELRSPLHGILAAGQLLSESEQSLPQMEFTQMIDTCARTLLDIMNHLLDHAKINHFIAQSGRHKRKAKPGSKNKQPQTYSLVTEMDLLSVFEETISSMAAGSPHVSQHTLFKTLTSAEAKEAASSVPIILHVTPHEDWMFRSEPGSWRRIIINLVGNALKYTQEGHVGVSLVLRNQEKGPGHCIAELKVTDTGQGMSEEYLKHRLYTPFAQEDNLTMGVGLGLSLVHQIVTTLRGSIQIHSEIGTGTEVSVQIPLAPVELIAREETICPIRDMDLKEAAKSWIVSFVGFDNPPGIHEQSTGLSNPRTAALIEMKQSLALLLTTWYGLQQGDDGSSHIIVIEELALAVNLQMYDQPNKTLLVVGLGGRGSFTKDIRHANFVYCLAPIGPTCISSALHRLFKSHKPKISPQTTQQKSSEGPLNMCDQQLPNHSQTASGTDVKAPQQDSCMETVTDPDSATTTVPRLQDGPPPQTLDSKRLLRNGPKPVGEVILLVDDNEINLRILVACIVRLKLQSIGYLTATNGKEALDKFVASTDAGIKVTTVFMDISMPVMDGIQATRAIRSFEKQKKVKREMQCRIIALTGLASAEAQRQVENGDFDLYFRKPVNLKTIREILQEECAVVGQ